MTKIHLAPAVGDDQLNVILKTIEDPDERPVVDKAAFKKYVNKRKGADVEATLDIIGHGDYGRLWCDNFYFDAGTMAALFPRPAPGAQPPFVAPEQHRFSAIRLLGCDTASFAVGRQAMTKLHDLFGVPVWGTQTALHAPDYDATGLLPKRGDLMVIGDEESPSRLPPPKSPEEAVADWQAHLPAAPMWQPAERRSLLLKQLQPQAQRNPFEFSRRDQTVLDRLGCARVVDQIMTAPWVALANGLQVRTSHVFWFPLSQSTANPRVRTVARIDALGDYPAIRLHPRLGGALRGFTAIVPTTQPLPDLLR